MAGAEDVVTEERAARAGRTWRSLLAVALVGLTVLGSTALTDDAWPFAPFRMFSRAVKPDGRVVKVDFLVRTESGEVLRLDASDWGLRRAEIEGQQGPGGRLTEEQLQALVEDYDRRHPDDPLEVLEFRRRGRVLEDGRPTATIDELIQAWPPGGDGGSP